MRSQRAEIPFRPPRSCRIKRSTMALRLSTPATAGSTSTAPSIEALPARARALLASGDLPGYRALFAEAAAEQDLHQRYGTRRELLQAGLAIPRASTKTVAYAFLAV